MGRRENTTLKDSTVIGYLFRYFLNLDSILQPQLWSKSKWQTMDPVLKREPVSTWNLELGISDKTASEKKPPYYLNMRKEFWWE